MSDRDAEVAALEKAVEEVASDLEARGAKAGGELADVLEAQATMARDPELLQIAAAAIKGEGTPAARAVVEAGEGYATILEQSESEYMAARAQDVRDVCERVARRLVGADEADLSAVDKPTIVVATDIMPADVAALDTSLVEGLATEQGSRTSHTAIVARSLGVPAVVGVAGLLDAVDHGAALGLDGDDGIVFVEPDETTSTELSERAAAREKWLAELRERAGEGPAATADDVRVELAANIANLAELEVALEAGAEGVGLLRTELLYLDRSGPPTEDEQAEIFASMAKLLGDRRLVVRTFDFGADKPVPFLEAEPGPNPALGQRGIRLARKHQDLLDAQLRAVTRAAEAGGKLAVMAPMVANLEETHWFVGRVVAAGGRDAGVEVGIMIEVPSVVFAVRELARELDFLSIGTNDLTQYLHAADRQQGSVAHLQDVFSPALTRAIRMVCEQAAESGAWVGVCGEAGGDPAWALTAVGLGVRELSMEAGAVIEVKAALRARTLVDCRTLADKVIDAPDAESARRLATEALR